MTPPVDPTALIGDLCDSLRSGYLFGHKDEPLDAYGRRLVRVIELRLRSLASAATPATEGQGHAATPAARQVGCEGEDGLLRVHAETETCEVCNPPAALDREALIARAAAHVADMKANWSEDSLRALHEEVGIMEGLLTQTVEAVDCEDDRNSDNGYPMNPESCPCDGCVLIRLARAALSPEDR